MKIISTRTIDRKRVSPSTLKLKRAAPSCAPLEARPTHSSRTWRPANSPNSVSAGRTLALWTFSEGSEVAAHRHPHEQMSFIQRGRFLFRVEGEANVRSARARWWCAGRTSSTGSRHLRTAPRTSRYSAPGAMTCWGSAGRIFRFKIGVVFSSCGGGCSSFSLEGRVSLQRYANKRDKTTSP